MNQTELNDLLINFLQDQHYNNRTAMCDLFAKEGSDKSKWHNYTTFYDYLFKALKVKPKDVFELGLGTNNLDVPSNMGHGGVPGASLRGFRTYFPDANIYGADVDARVLFREDRIETYYCDQTDPETIKYMWEQIPVEQFDIVLEDGLHETFANKIFFENSYHKVKKGGIYIIEDIVNSEKENVKEFLKDIECSAKSVFTLPITLQWTSIFPNLAGRVNNHDNSLAVIIK